MPTKKPKKKLSIEKTSIQRLTTVAGGIGIPRSGGTRGGSGSTGGGPSHGVSHSSISQGPISSRPPHRTGGTVVQNTVGVSVAVTYGVSGDGGDGQDDITG